MNSRYVKCQCSEFELTKLKFSFLFFLCIAIYLTLLSHFLHSFKTIFYCTFLLFTITNFESIKNAQTQSSTYIFHDSIKLNLKKRQFFFLSSISYHLNHIHSKVGFHTKVCYGIFLFFSCCMQNETTS